MANRNELNFNENNSVFCVVDLVLFALHLNCGIEYTHNIDITFSHNIFQLNIMLFHSVNYIIISSVY